MKLEGTFYAAETIKNYQCQTGPTMGNSNYVYVTLPESSFKATGTEMTFNIQMDINKWFEEALNRLSKVDRKKKMRMRRKVRDEVYFLLTWAQPTPAMIINRWEERMSDVFLAMPYGLKDELLRLLVKKMEIS
mgnify:CR=1 FL=1